MLRNRALQIVILLLVIGPIMYYIHKSHHKPVLSKNLKPSYTLFNPNYDVTYEQLLADGFKHKEENEDFDFEKKLDSTTTISYRLDREYKLVMMEAWIIKFDTFDIQEVERFIDEKGARIMTDICVNKKREHRFFIQSYNTDFFFYCIFYDKHAVEQVGDLPTLVVHHYYPASVRGLMKDHPMYRQ